MKLRRFGTAVVNGDPDEDVFWSALRVFDEDVEVPVLVERARIEQFVFELLP